MLGQRSTQALEVTRTQRHGPATHRAARRVREAHEPLSLVGLEQLHDRREPLVTRPLLQRQLLELLSCTQGVAVFVFAVAFVAM